MINVLYNLHNLIIIIKVIQQYDIVNANNSRKSEKIHKISSLDNVVSSNQFCNDTIVEPKLEPIMCPKLFSSSPHIHGHFCPRLFDLNISLLQSSSYAVT